VVDFVATEKKKVLESFKEFCEFKLKDLIGFCTFIKMIIHNMFVDLKDKILIFTL